MRFERSVHLGSTDLPTNLIKDAIELYYGKCSRYRSERSLGYIDLDFDHSSFNLYSYESLTFMEVLAPFTLTLKILICIVYDGRASEQPA